MNGSHLGLLQQYCRGNAASTWRPVCTIDPIDSIVHTAWHPWAPAAVLDLFLSRSSFKGTAADEARRPATEQVITRTVHYSLPQLSFRKSHPPTSFALLDRVLL